MNKELRDLLAQLEAKETEQSELKAKGEIRQAHALMGEIEELEMAIDVAKAEEKRSKEVIVKKTDEEVRKMENEKLQLESMEYRQAFIKYISGNKDSMTEAETRALTVASSGGAIVPTTIMGTIQQLLKQFSPIRQVASVLSSSSNLTINIESTGAVATWTAEGTGIGETNPTVRNVNFNAFKLATMVKLSNELIADNVVNIESYIAEKIAEAYIDAEGDAFINGDGVGKPKGLLATGVTYKEVVSKTTLKVDLDDLISVYSTILPKYRVNASWIVSNDVFTQLMALKDGMGHPILAMNVAQDVPYAIFGRPLLVDPKLPSFDAIGKKSLLFGDFKRAYQIVDRAEMTMRTSTERFIDNDQTVVVATKRMDGQPMDLNALAVLKSK